MYEKFGLFIGGEWRSTRGHGSAEVIDPATEDVLGHIPQASVEDVEQAIDAAATGLKLWRQTPAWTRADILHRVADEMLRATEEGARRITLESGKPLVQAKREWQLSVDQFRWCAEEARRIYGRIVESRVPGGRFEVLHEPVGIVAAFTAWNFPAVLIVRKVAPALAAGCSIIVRPSTEVPGVAMVIFECLRKAGVPAGVANLVSGPTSTTYATLVASAQVRKITLTGSTSVGQQMIRDSAQTLKRVSMELGGNAPLVVFDDADLETALDLAVATKYANAGQVCVTPDRFYVQKGVYNRFVAGFSERAKALRLGNGLDEATQMGPLINQRRREAIESIVADSVALGASVAAGGHRPPGFGNGFFFEPTVLSDVPPQALALAEENFGPIAAITPFGDPEDAYSWANDSPYGLSAYVFTRDPGRIREAVSRIEAGMIGVNSFALAAAEVPFGGIKSSGMGREGGVEGVLDFMNVKLAQIAV